MKAQQRVIAGFPLFLPAFLCPPAEGEIFSRRAFFKVTKPGVVTSNHLRTGVED